MVVDLLEEASSVAKDLRRVHYSGLLCALFTSTKVKAVLKTKVHAIKNQMGKHGSAIEGLQEALAARASDAEKLRSEV